MRRSLGAQPRYMLSFVQALAPLVCASQTDGNNPVLLAARSRLIMVENIENRLDRIQRRPFLTGGHNLAFRWCTSRRRTLLGVAVC